MFANSLIVDVFLIAHEMSTLRFTLLAGVLKRFRVYDISYCNYTLPYSNQRGLLSEQMKLNPKSLFSPASRAKRTSAGGRMLEHELLNPSVYPAGR